MNLSGESILALASFFKIEPSEILVCHDETADFWRLRFGISKPAGVNIADYVLSDFKSDEAITMSLVYEKAGELFCRALLAADPQRLLPQWAKVKVD